MSQEEKVQLINSEQIPLKTEDADEDNNVVGWVDTPDYIPPKDINTVKYDTCCACDRCIIVFATFWLGCGCVQLGYSVIFWYILNLGFDIYNFVTDSNSHLLLVLYTFNIIFVDIPVLFFTIRDQQNKLIFPFSANVA
eukprot:995414_1